MGSESNTVLRTGWIDSAKAIGIFLVVFGHVARGLISAGIAPERGPIHDLTEMVYTFHMPLFFFLSGLFFRGSFLRHGFVRLLLSKVDTLIYPYLLWTVLQGAVMVLASRYTNSHTSWSQVAAAIWHPGAQMWFLYALFEFFVISSIVAATGWRWAGGVAAVLAMSVGHILVRPPGVEIPAVSYAWTEFSYFAVGVLCTESFPAKRFARPIPLALLATGFAVGQWLQLRGGFGPDARGIAASGLAWVSILLATGIAHLLSGGRLRWLEKVGASSMPIFILHIIAAAGTRAALARVAGVTNPWVQLGVGCLVGVSGPLVLVRILGAKGRILFAAPLARRFATASSSS